MIVFVHIPKNGGTTFRHILINNYHFNHMDVRYLFGHGKPVTGQNRRIFTDREYFFLKKINPMLKSISGHPIRFSDNLFRSEEGIKYITFLRDPIKRIISLYHHSRRNDSRLKFKDWANDVSKYDFCNYQTQWFSGDYDINKAKDVLSNFYFVGILEEYDRSLIILKNRLLDKDFDIRYEKKRVSTFSDDQIINNPANKSILDKLRQNNSLDFELYRFARQELFAKYQKEIGFDIKSQTNEFILRNRAYKFDNRKSIIFKIVKYLVFNTIFTILIDLRKWD